jgi:hypothetical protein
MFTVVSALAYELALNYAAYLFVKSCYISHGSNCCNSKRLRMGLFDTAPRGASASASILFFEVLSNIFLENRFIREASEERIYFVCAMEIKLKKLAPATP